MTETEPKSSGTAARQATVEDPRKAFLRFLAELSDGARVAQWGKDLRELVEAVRDTGNPAEFRIVLKIELQDAADRGHVVVFDKTTTKRPRPTPEPTEFTIGPAGALTPLQPLLDGMN